MACLLYTSLSPPQQRRQTVLALRVPQVRGPAVQSLRLLRVLLCAVAGLIAYAQPGHGPDMAPLRRTAEIGDGPVIILLGAVAEIITHARLAQSIGIVSLGGGQEAAEGLLLAALHALALVIAQSQEVPGPGTAPLRRLAEQAGCLQMCIRDRSM